MDSKIQTLQSMLDKEMRAIKEQIGEQYKGHQNNQPFQRNTNIYFGEDSRNDIILKDKKIEQQQQMETTSNQRRFQGEYGQLGKQSETSNHFAEQGHANSDQQKPYSLVFGQNYATLPQRTAHNNNFDLQISNTSLMELQQNAIVKKSPKTQQLKQHSYSNDFSMQNSETNVITLNPQQGDTTIQEFGEEDDAVPEDGWLEANDLEQSELYSKDISDLHRKLEVLDQQLSGKQQQQNQPTTDQFSQHQRQQQRGREQSYVEEVNPSIVANGISEGIDYGRQSTAYLPEAAESEYAQSTSQNPHTELIDTLRQAQSRCESNQMERNGCDEVTNQKFQKAKLANRFSSQIVDHAHHPYDSYSIHPSEEPLQKDKVRHNSSSSNNRRCHRPSSERHEYRSVPKTVTAIQYYPGGLFNLFPGDAHSHGYGKMIELKRRLSVMKTLNQKEKEMLQFERSKYATIQGEMQRIEAKHKRFSLLVQHNSSSEAAYQDLLQQYAKSTSIRNQQNILIAELKKQLDSLKQQNGAVTYSTRGSRLSKN